MLSSLEKVDDEGRRSSLLDTMCNADVSVMSVRNGTLFTFQPKDALNLPVHPRPPSMLSGELKVDLLRHQVCSSIDI